MLQNAMQGKRDSIIDGSVGPVGELVRVQLMISGCLEGPENQALEHIHDHEGQSDRSVVVQACYAGLLGNQHYGGGLEASRDVALLQRLEQSSEHWSQLVRTRPQGGRGHVVRILIKVSSSTEHD